MTYTELQETVKVLRKIKNKDTHVDRAIAFVEKDIALREAQRNVTKNVNDYEF